MDRFRRVGALALLLLVSTAAAGAASDSQLQTVIELDTGYALGPACFPITCDFEMTDSLTIVGMVNAFLPPLDELNTPPHPQYTYLFRGLRCTGTGMWDDFINHRGGYYAEFAGGVLEIRSDRTTGARFQDPVTFFDGEVLIRFDLGLFRTGFWPYTQDANLQVTGGTLFDRLSTDGVGYTGANLGYFWTEYWIDPAYGDLGYIVDSTSRVDLALPTPVRATTWGRIKRQYR